LGDHGYHVESAGVSAFGSAPASDEAVATMRARGIDISDHRSQPVDREQLIRTDYVLAMTASHARQLEALAKGATTDIRRIDEKDIEDPIGGDSTDYARCADQIASALRQQLSQLGL
jgi:protein-tyrosine-phosphatase